MAEIAVLYIFTAISVQYCLIFTGGMSPMQEPLSELSRKYREEMLRLYASHRAAEPAPPEPESQELSLSTIQHGNVENLPPDAETDIEFPQESDFGVEESLPEVITEPEHDEEPLLPEYIAPPMPVPSSDMDAEQAEIRRNTAAGKLVVAAFTGNGAYPVPGAGVQISTMNGGIPRLRWMLSTNESGETPVVEMPAPPAELSQTPDAIRPYAICTIAISAEGYFRTVAEEVPVFAGITSRQTFEMIPLPLEMPEDMETLHFSRTEEMRNADR